MERTLRVVAPLTIHQEAVMMLAWREFQVRSPDSISAFLQRDGFLIPVRKVSGQLHVGRTWGADGEGLRSPLMVIA